MLIHLINIVEVDFTHFKFNPISLFILMFSFSKFYRKLRIRTQILCFQVAILVATAALVTGSLFFLSFYMIT